MITLPYKTHLSSWHIDIVSLTDNHVQLCATHTVQSSCWRSTLINDTAAKLTPDCVRSNMELLWSWLQGGSNKQTPLGVLQD